VKLKGTVLANAPVGKARAKSTNSVIRLIFCSSGWEERSSALFSAHIASSVQANYQVVICGDSEDKRSSSGWPYQFCFKVSNGLRLKHKFLQGEEKWPTAGSR
jgi:hypothetical protein